jgi:hypothetical protein
MLNVYITIIGISIVFAYVFVTITDFCCKNIGWDCILFYYLLLFTQFILHQ